MSEPLAEIAVGDEIRAHYHPSHLTQSFVEGIVRRIDVSTLRGRVFVLDTTYEVIHDREQPIRQGYKNYILYERWDDFPGRIEVLSSSEISPEPSPEPLDPSDRFEVQIERTESRKPSNIIATIFGRAR